jgi:hypothetical protein
MSDLKIKSQAQQTLNNTIAVGATATTYVYLENKPVPTGPAGGPKRPGPPGAAR